VDTSKEVDCQGYVCRIKRHTTPNECGKVKQANKLCDQCQQHTRALALCKKLEKHIVTHRPLQRTLTLRTQWKRIRLAGHILRRKSTRLLVNEWDRSYKLISADKQVLKRHVQDACQMLSQTILRRDPTRTRQYDPNPSQQRQTELLRPPLQDTCFCPTYPKRRKGQTFRIQSPIPKTLRPSICPHYNSPRPHQYHTEQINQTPPQHSCRLCGDPPPRFGEIGYEPYVDRTFICQLCSIACLCKYNPAELRFQRYEEELTRPRALPPNPYKRLKKAPPKKKIQRIRLAAQGPPRPPATAANLFPINPTLLQKCKDIIFDPARNEESKLHDITSNTFPHFTRSHLKLVR